MGNWRRLEDLDKICQGDLVRARQLIGLELDWLCGLGVRQVTPIHLTNNAFGGTAIYLRFLETVNMFVTGERWTVDDAWETGVRYRLDQDGEDVVDEAERTVVLVRPAPATPAPADAGGPHSRHSPNCSKRWKRPISAAAMPMRAA